MDVSDNLPKMTLWYHPKLRSTRCVWLIKELGIEHAVDYRYVPIGPPPMCPEREEYKKRVHPHGLVPALEIEGRPPMFESGAICMYLVDLCGRLGPEPKEKSEYYNWMFYCTSTLDGAMSTLARQWMFTPKERQDSQLISTAKALADLCLDTLNAAMDGRQFLLGDRFTAADCVLGYNVVWASVLNKEELLSGRSNLLKYLHTIMTRPALQQALALNKKAAEEEPAST